MWVSRLNKNRIATLQTKKNTKEKKLKLPPIICLFHEYSIINEWKQFSKNKIKKYKDDRQAIRQ